MEIKLSILIASIPSRFEMMQKLYNKLLKEIGDLPIEILCFIDNKKRSIGKKRESLVQLAKGEYISFIDDDEDYFEGYAQKILKAIESQKDIITFKQKCTINGKSFLVDFSTEYSNENARFITIGYYDYSHLQNIQENIQSKFNKTENILDENSNEKQVKLVSIDSKYIEENYYIDGINEKILSNEENIYMDEKNEKIFLLTNSFDFKKEKKYINIKRQPFHICAWKSEIAKSELFSDVGYSEDWDWCKRLIPKLKSEFKINEVLHHYIFDDKITEAPTETNEIWTNNDQIGIKKMKYSQNDEQDYICNYFNEKKGVFLEIGAFDPKVFSNTRSLVERGWSGTYVESSPICAEKFRIEYKDNSKINLIEAAVSDKDGFDTLYDCNGNGVSTTDIDHKIKWEIGDMKFNEIQVKFISMESLLKTINQKVDFLNLDVEGTNIKLFDLITDDFWSNLKMLCIEHDGKEVYIAEKLKDFGFKFISHNAENLILAK